MSGRDQLPHFPAPAKSPRQQQQQSRSQGNMYQQQQNPQYNQQPGAIPGGYPPAGYQVGPPSTGYGSPPAPQQVYQTQQGYTANRPVSSQAPPGVDTQLYGLFRAADTNNSGQLSERELSRALVNGDWTPFDAKTVKLMVKMFDADQ